MWSYPNTAMARVALATNKTILSSRPLSNSPVFSVKFNDVYTHQKPRLVWVARGHQQRIRWIHCNAFYSTGMTNCPWRIDWQITTWRAWLHRLRQRMKRTSSYRARNGDWLLHWWSLIMPSLSSSIVHSSSLTTNFYSTRLVRNAARNWQPWQRTLPHSCMCRTFLNFAGIFLPSLCLCPSPSTSSTAQATNPIYLNPDGIISARLCKVGMSWNPSSLWHLSYHVIHLYSLPYHFWGLSFSRRHDHHHHRHRYPRLLQQLLVRSTPRRHRLLQRRHYVEIKSNRNIKNSHSYNNSRNNH